MKWQAAKILGSVDFLGNPLGFVADVSEGVSGLLLEGNVGALLKNVTHGISNSAAKVTGNTLNTIQSCSNLQIISYFSLSSTRALTAEFTKLLQSYFLVRMFFRFLVLCIHWM